MATNSTHFPEFAERPDGNNSLPPAQAETTVFSSVPLTPAEFELIRAHRKNLIERELVMSEKPIQTVMGLMRQVQALARNNSDTRYTLEQLQAAFDEFESRIRNYGENT